MNDKTLLRRGLIGSVFAAICCFTPLLVVLVAGAGLSALVGWLDYALFPLLFASLGVVAHALWLQAGKPGRCPKNLIVVATVVLSVLLIWLEFRFALRISVAAALSVALYAVWLKRAHPTSPATTKSS
ncbi:MAG: mercury resistance system transport protein MerF [Alphaproteobacteria bacterium]|nr:mercury resistance system transport protein MerF [Alphaproteobacteria bacterium]